VQYAFNLSRSGSDRGWCSFSGSPITLYRWQDQIKDMEVRMFENRCPVCNNELIDTAYGRLCSNPACGVFDEYMLFEEIEGAQYRSNNLILLRNRQAALSPLLKNVSTSGNLSRCTI
jgi:hypothetical protein